MKIAAVIITILAFCGLCFAQNDNPYTRRGLRKPTQQSIKEDFEREKLSTEESAPPFNESAEQQSSSENDQGFGYQAGETVSSFNKTASTTGETVSSFGQQ